MKDIKGTQGRKGEKDEKEKGKKHQVIDLALELELACLNLRVVEQVIDH